MTRSELEFCFSRERLHSFFLKYPDDDSKGAYLYIANKQLSESFYVSLSVLEVSLRNSIDKSFRRRYNRRDWYEFFKTNDTLESLYHRDIITAKRKLSKNRKPFTAGRIIAELNFGFWTKLFNDEYEMELWKPLSLAFPYMPKKIRQRNRIKSPLNLIRKKIRNRVYHYEPIIFKIDELEDHHSDICQLIHWIDPKINNWLKKIDRFPITLVTVKENITTF